MNFNKSCKEDDYKGLYPLKYMQWSASDECVIKNGVEVYAVSGNHDLGAISALDMPHMIDGKIIEIDGLRIGGYDWQLHDVML